MAVDDQGPKVVWVMWIVTLVPFLIVTLRIYCKFLLSRGFGWDDHIIVFSEILLIVYTALITGAVKLGVGKHLEDVNPATLSLALELTYIGEFIAIIGCVLSKTSFAVTLLRIVTQKWQKGLLWFIIVTMNLIMWLTAICYLAQCSPTAKLWNFTLEGKCWNPEIVTDLAIFAGAYSGVMDLVLAMLPWWIIWNLQMKMREKLGIAVAMSLGVFASATAFVKTSYLPNLSKQSDFTYYGCDILIWAAAETGSTIVAASIPSLRILAIKMRSSYDRSDPKTGESYHISQGKSRSGRRRVHSGSFNNEHHTIVMPTKRDDGSDKSILGNSAIKQTQEITVTYEQSGGKKVDEFQFDRERL